MTQVSLSEMTFCRGERKIFDNVSFSFPKNKITFVMGPSGTGKTTLLQLITGQLTPHSGKITVNDTVLSTLSRQKLYQFRRCMSMQFQRDALFTNISVFDNVAFPLREHTKLSESMIRDIVLLKLEAVGLRGAHNVMPHQLSGGMARRVSLARAIALDPELMLYDEPFTGQDPISKAVLFKLIRELHDSLSMTTIIVAHDVDAAMEIADYVYVLAQGKVVAEGTPEDIKQSQAPSVKQFFHGLPDGPVAFHYPSHSLEADLFGETS